MVGFRSFICHLSDQFFLPFRSLSSWVKPQYCKCGIAFHDHSADRPFSKQIQYNGLRQTSTRHTPVLNMGCRHAQWISSYHSDNNNTTCRPACPLRVDYPNCYFRNINICNLQSILVLCGSVWLYCNQNVAFTSSHSIIHHFIDWLRQFSQLLLYDELELARPTL